MSQDQEIRDEIRRFVERLNTVDSTLQRLNIDTTLVNIPTAQRLWTREQDLIRRILFPIQYHSPTDRINVSDVNPFEEWMLYSMPIAESGSETESSFEEEEYDLWEEAPDEAYDPCPIRQTRLNETVEERNERVFKRVRHVSDKPPINTMNTCPICITTTLNEHNTGPTCAQGHAICVECEQLDNWIYAERMLCPLCRELLWDDDETKTC